MIQNRYAAIFKKNDGMGLHTDFSFTGLLFSPADEADVQREKNFVDKTIATIEKCSNVKLVEMESRRIQ